MASFAVVVKPAGGNTSAMAQEQAKNYLRNVLGANAGTRLTNLVQCLNNVFGDEGKSNGALTFAGHPTRHASHGVMGVSSVTLFFYVAAGTAYIFAMGEHQGAHSYKISFFGPTDGTFKAGKTVTLT